MPPESSTASPPDAPASAAPCTSASDTSVDDVDDALHAIDTMTTWVTHADTKAGLLATAVAVVIAAIAQDRDTISDVVRASGAAEVISAAILAGIGGLLLVAVVALGVAVTPRTRLDSRPTRFGLPTLASPGWTRTYVPRSEISDEAWLQATTLARIANRKFSFIRTASIAVTSALVLLIAWTFSTSFVT